MSKSLSGKLQPPVFSMIHPPSHLIPFQPSHSLPHHWGLPRCLIFLALCLECHSFPFLSHIWPALRCPCYPSRLNGNVCSGSLPSIPSLGPARCHCLSALKRVCTSLYCCTWRCNYLLSRLSFLLHCELSQYGDCAVLLFLCPEGSVWPYAKYSINNLENKGKTLD